MINKKGLTLIEPLLYISIAATIILVVSMLLGTILGARIKNKTISEVEGQGMQVASIITQTLRNGDAIVAPVQGSSGALLSVVTLDISKNPTVFDVLNGALRITEGTASPIALTNSKVMVTDLTFYEVSENGAPGAIKFQFTISYINPDGRSEFDYSKTFVGGASLRHP